MTACSPNHLPSLETYFDTLAHRQFSKVIPMVQTRLKVGPFEAWVEVEKQRVEHYDIDVDEESKIQVATAWIASTAGKVESTSFSITLR